MSTPGLAEEAQMLLDVAVRDPPRVGKRRQPRLDDLALAGALRLAVRDRGRRRRASGRTGRTILLAFLRLEAADDPLARAVEHPDDRAGGLAGVAAAAARGPGALLAGQHGVAVHRAVHARARHEEVFAVRHEDEAETLGPHRDPAGDQVRELDGRVLLAADSGDLAPALERVEALPQASSSSSSAMPKAFAGSRRARGRASPSAGGGRGSRIRAESRAGVYPLGRRALRVLPFGGFLGREEARASRRGSRVPGARPCAPSRTTDTGSRR